MTAFKEYEKVRIKNSGATGTIVDIDTKGEKTFYCVEYDEEFRYLDEDMGVTYCTEDELEKTV